MIRATGATLAVIGVVLFLSASVKAAATGQPIVADFMVALMCVVIGFALRRVRG